MGQNDGRAAGRLYRLGNWTVRIVGCAIFSYLTWYSFRYTRYIAPGAREVPVDMQDSFGRNVLCALLAVGVLAALMLWEKKAGRRLRNVASRGLMALTFAWIALAGIWWTYASPHVPVGDQAFIYGGASYFIEGQYHFLGKGGYCTMFPYQLGLTALCELLFRMVGTYNYRAFEIICIAMAAGCAYLGYRILSEMTESRAVAIGYQILMAGCLPLIFYTPWVYGDIPSIFFALLAEWALLRYGSGQKLRYLAVLASALVLAILVRLNSAIIFVAVCLAILLYAFLHRDKRIVLAFMIAIVCSCCSFWAIFRMYEVRSGYKKGQSIPLVASITMGMMESYGAYGWFNNYNKEVFYGADCDSGIAAETARRDLEDRLRVFWEDRDYAKLFFREKLLSQWNAPLYQSLYFNADLPDKAGAPDPDSLAAKLGGVYFERVLALCDRWQAIVYAGMLCYFLFAVRRDSDILQHTLAIAVIGGFLFSIVYEAKARYIFPYYVMMFPFAVYGYRQALLFVAQRWRKRPAGDLGGSLL